jgi:hypothetical protein
MRYILKKRHFIVTISKNKKLHVIMLLGRPGPYTEDILKKSHLFIATTGKGDNPPYTPL